MQSGASAWNASSENEFGTCLDPDLAGGGFLSSIVGLWRRLGARFHSMEEVVGSIPTALPTFPQCLPWLPRDCLHRAATSV
jgi:hypothetical protein